MIAHTRPVGPLGFEPRTFRLRAGSSTAELGTHGGRGEIRTREVNTPDLQSGCFGRLQYSPVPSPKGRVALQVGGLQLIPVCAAIVRAPLHLGVVFRCCLIKGPGWPYYRVPPTFEWGRALQG